MVYKAKQNWKDLIEKPAHHGLTRRDLLARGMATGFLSLALPEFLLESMFSRANAAPLVCPPSTLSKGCIAQIFSQGGPTMGARFIGEDQAAMMNATMAANYGITGTNMLKLGPNLVIDTTSPFGATIMQGPTGFPGGAAAWQTTVLNKISGGGHRGPFNMDDGAGVDTGLMGGASPFKATQLGKDLRIGANNAMANWARGLPMSAISGGGLNTAALARLFSVTPAATGLITPQSLNDASTAATDLAEAMAVTFKNDQRNGASTLTTNAGCSFFGNAALADPAFGTNLFTPTAIAPLTANLTVTSLSAPEQALLAAYYQSAMGVIGAVILELGGRDYHGQNPQTVIAPADIEEARAIVMFLAACHAAQAPGAFLYFSNGQAIASGVQSVTATIGGVATTVNAPLARGDAGGSYNAGLIIFYSPTGAQPAPIMTGAISSSGNATSAPTVSASASAVSGLYLSALKWINGGVIPPAALTAMGVPAPSNIVVI